MFDDHRMIWFIRTVNTKRRRFFHTNSTTEGTDVEFDKSIYEMSHIHIRKFFFFEYLNIHKNPPTLLKYVVACQVVQKTKGEKSGKVSWNLAQKAHMRSHICDFFFEIYSQDDKRLWKDFGSWFICKRNWINS